MLKTELAPMFISSFLWQRRENAFHKNCITIFSYFTFLGFSDSFKFSTQFLIHIGITGTAVLELIFYKYENQNTQMMPRDEGDSRSWLSPGYRVEEPDAKARGG